MAVSRLGDRTRRMAAETAVADRRAAIVVFLTTAKRAVRSATLWGVLFGGLIANEALSY